MCIRLGFVGLLSLILAFGCDDAAEGPSGTPNTGPGSISGSYNPDGVVAVISGQVLLQAAAEGAHSGTQVAVRGYSSTATTNAEGLFRLELILAEEDITRSDADDDTPLSVSVLLTHPGYTPAEVGVTVAPGEAVALDTTVTLEVILGRVFGRLTYPVGLNPADFSGSVVITLSASQGESQTTAHDDNGAFVFSELSPDVYALTIEGGPFNRSERSVSVGPGDRTDVGDTPVQLKESERLNYETAIEGVVKLQGITDDNAHGGIRVESVGTAFATVTASSGRYRLSVAPGMQTLQFSYPGYGTQTLEVPEVAARQSTRLSEAVVLTARPGRITGTVRLAQYDTPGRLQGVDVSLVDGTDTTVLTANPDAGGRYTFADVTPGEWRVSASRTGYASQSSFVMVDAGQSVEANPLTLAHTSTTAAAVRFTGAVTLADMADSSGTEIRLLLLPDALPADGMNTRSDGSFDLPAALDERYEVQVVRPRFEVPQGWGPFTYNGTAFVDENGNPASIELAAFAGPEGDADGDGIANGADNCPNLANPLQADHENDGIGDLCDPDDDNDGLNDAEEVLLGTDPLLADTDEDGLNDLFEQRGQTNPLNPDTDGDGESDGVELTNLERPEDLDEDGLWDAVESSIRDDDGDGASDEIDGPGPLGDRDGDGILNGLRERGVCIDPVGCDNCFNTSNVDQLNTDGDAKGDACDTDDDDDGEPDNLDNCRLVVNVEQIDTDSDTRGDACDLDDDGDGLNDLLEAELGSNPLLADTDGDSIPDGIGDGLVADNCIAVRNMDQADHEGDGIGDACDPDDDNDGALDAVPADSVALPDNCPFIPNIDQLNTDGDTFGNACDVDDDNDSVLDIEDNCPLNVNPLQSDYDIDGSGDACDDDDDQDGVDDDTDNCPFTFNPDQTDTSGDGIGDLCSNDIDTDGVVDGRDNCLNIPNADQRDIDADGLGDACDLDIDGDGLVGANTDGLPDVDNCDAVYNPRQLDLDNDGLGDLCDLDDDGDGIADADDSCPLVTNLNSDLDADNIDAVCDNCPDDFNIFQRDLDGDGAGDVCDDDDDDDQIPDAQDNCPNKPNFDQVDRDGDGRGDACSVFLVNHLPDHNIQDMASDADSVWIASTGGMTHWLYNHQSEEYTTTRHTTASGMPGNNAHSVDIDGNGNPYVLIDGVGLYVYIVAADEWRLIPLTLDDVGDCAVTPTSQMVDVTVNRTTGTIYVSFKAGQNNGGGVVYGTPGNWSCWPRGAGIPDGEVKRVELAPNGDVWVITDFGLGRYRQSDQWARFTPPERLPSPTVHGIGFIGEDVWVSTDEGGVVMGTDGRRLNFSSPPILRFSGAVEEESFRGFGTKGLHHFTRDNQFISHQMKVEVLKRSLVDTASLNQWVSAPHGVYWASSSKGLYATQQIRERSELNFEAVIERAALAEDGNLYLAIGCDGLVKINPDSWERVTVDDGCVFDLTVSGSTLFYRRDSEIVQLDATGVRRVICQAPSQCIFDEWAATRFWLVGERVDSGTHYYYDRLSDEWFSGPAPIDRTWGWSNTASLSRLGTVATDRILIIAYPTGHSPPKWFLLDDEWWTYSNVNVDRYFTGEGSPPLFLHNGLLIGGADNGLYLGSADGVMTFVGASQSTNSIQRLGRAGYCVRTWSNSSGPYCRRADDVVEAVTRGYFELGAFSTEPESWIEVSSHRVVKLSERLGVENFGLRSTAHELIRQPDDRVEIVGSRWSYHPDSFRRFEIQGRLGFRAAAYGNKCTYSARGQSGFWCDFKRYNSDDGFDASEARDVLISNLGGVWVATERGVFRLRNDTFTQFDFGSGSGRNVRDLVEDREGRLYAATANGVWRFDGTEFIQSEGLTSQDVRQLLVDRNGQLWAATAAGLARRVSPERFVPYVLPGLGQPPVRSLSQLYDGRLMVGSDSQGLIVVEQHGAVAQYTVESAGLVSNSIGDVYAEPFADGRAWLIAGGRLAEFIASPNDTSEPICGDGLVAFTEACDDGNDNDADGCRSDCTLP